jgi:hypothetical protein
MESILADRIVSLSWRLKRADLIQNQTIDAMYEKITSDPLANLAKSFGLKGLANPQPETSDPPPDLTLGRIAIKDFSNARVLDRLLMYERRIEHSLYKTTLELQRLRLLKTLEHPNAADPATPNPLNCNPAHAGIPIHQEPIINNQSSIVNIESTPKPGQNHPTSTIQACPPKAESSIIAQNKPNVKIGKMTISPVTTKPYLNEQRTTNNERDSKQTQSNPIPARREPPAIRNTRYAVRNNAIRNNAIRNTQYEIRTLHNRRRAAII